MQEKLLVNRYKLFVNRHCLAFSKLSRIKWNKLLVLETFPKMLTTLVGIVTYWFFSGRTTYDMHGAWYNCRVELWTVGPSTCCIWSHIPDFKSINTLGIRIIATKIAMTDGMRDADGWMDKVIPIYTHSFSRGIISFRSIHYYLVIV